MSTEQTTPISVELVVVGASWCDPCKKVKAELPALLEGLVGELLVKHLDVDEDEEECDEINVTKIPTLVFRYGGKERERHVGGDSVLLGKFISKCKVHLSLGRAFGDSI